jgi:hypothetical protein
MKPLRFVVTEIIDKNKPTQITTVQVVGVGTVEFGAGQQPFEWVTKSRGVCQADVTKLLYAYNTAIINGTDVDVGTQLG